MSKKRDRFNAHPTVLKFVKRWPSNVIKAGRKTLLLVAMAAAWSVQPAFLRQEPTAQAQSVSAVDADNTVGTRVNFYPDFNAFLVTGGTVRGSSLFHSFETFSPEELRTQFWLGAPWDQGAANGVTNIFSRVTGDQASSLNGLLEVIGGLSPNFFLLNPNGVLIGPEANISVPGSFFVSSAEAVLFEEGPAFSTTDTTEQPLLSISAPIGVQFGESAGAIAVDGPNNGRYSFANGAAVTLLGNGVDIADSYFRTVSGRVQVGSVGDNAQVRFDADTHVLSYAENTPRQNISLRNVGIDVDSKFDVDGDGEMDGGGNIQLFGDEVTGDLVLLSSDTSGAQDGGLVEIDATTFTIKNGLVTAAVFNRNTANGWSIATGRGSDISIVADTFISEGRTTITTDTYSLGDGGNLSIVADNVSLLGVPNTGDSPDFSNRLSTSTYHEGQGGNLNIRANNRFLANGSTLVTASTDLPRTGEDPAQIQEGNGGKITINAEEIVLEELAQVGSGTFSSGDAGKLEIQATERIIISGFYETDADSNDGIGHYSSGIYTTAERGSDGNGGQLRLTTPQLILTNGGTISGATSGTGNGGAVNIYADEISVSGPQTDTPLTGNGIVADVSESGSGQGGSLNILSDRIHIFDGGQITASTQGDGNAGDVFVRSRIIDIEGSGNGKNSSISSSSIARANAGSVTLQAESLTISDQGTLSVSSTNGGVAGNLIINANQVTLRNGLIQADADAGDQANIDITSQDLLLLRHGSNITTNATQSATGGNITLNAPIIVGSEDSNISANAVEGNGGNIRLITNGLIGLEFRDEPTPENDITASSELGVNGTVNIESPNVDTDSGLVQLPENLADASDQVATSCAAENSNRFASTGRGGLPTNPLQTMSSNRPWSDARAIAALPTVSEIDGTNENLVQADDVGDAIAEAGEWQVNSAGEVELVAADAVAVDAKECLASGFVG